MELQENRKLVILLLEKKVFILFLTPLTLLFWPKGK